MASDCINFRVGPARYFQLRDDCGNYTNLWKLRNNSEIKDYETDSPLIQPWFVLPKSNIPNDWIPGTSSDGAGHWRFGNCHYEAELGTSRQTSQTIMDSLYEGAWLDNNTNLLFFEQTYFNGNLNSLELQLKNCK